MIRLSLIIPTHNRSERLIAALESVIRQDLPAADWECVVVSNNSTDDTVARFGDFAARYPGLNLRLVTEDGPGVSLCPQPGHCRDFGSAAGFHRRRRAYQSGILARLCRLFSMRIPTPSWPGAHYRRVCDGTSRVALEIYRDADRQSDGFRRRRAAVSCRPGAGRRQHGVPAFGGPALRGLRPFAGACRTDVDRGVRRTISSNA